MASNFARVHKLARDAEEAAQFGRREPGLIGDKACRTARVKLKEAGRLMGRVSGSVQRRAARLLATERLRDARKHVSASCRSRK